jgi:DNA-binding transcriptional ArsR family regulator
MATVPDTCGPHFADLDRVERARAALHPEPTVSRLAETFRILGDPTRVRIVLALSAEELCVCDLASLLGNSVSAVSHQLRKLRDLRLVRIRRDGRRSYYRLDDEHIESLIGEGLRHVLEHDPEP